MTMERKSIGFQPPDRASKTIRPERQFHWPRSRTQLLSPLATVACENVRDTVAGEDIDGKGAGEDLDDTVAAPLKLLVISQNYASLVLLEGQANHVNYFAIMV